MVLLGEGKLREQRFAMENCYGCGKNVSTAQEKKCLVVPLHKQL